MINTTLTKLNLGGDDKIDKKMKNKMKKQDTNKNWIKMNR